MHKNVIVLVGLIGGATWAQDGLILKPAEYIGVPKEAHATDFRAFQGISSLAVSPKGRIWVNWYAGITPNEDRNNYVVLTTSGDGGKTWKEVLVVDPDGTGPVRTFDPELWVAPNGKLYFFWAQSIGHQCTTGGVWFVVIDNPDDECPHVSAPTRVCNGVMMCKPIVLSTGEWVLPASTWRETDYSAKMIVSTDCGKTWAERGGANVPKKDRVFDEHMIVERKNQQLWMLVRTAYGIGESVSSDRGMTWSEVRPSTIPHTGSRFFISRLQSGNLLLVKHGRITEKTGRSHLRAFLSEDDGRSWKGDLLLDEREGISYPDGQQEANGLIRLTYDFSRTGKRHILMCTFREADILAGNVVSADGDLRRLVSEGSISPQKMTLLPFPAVKPHSDGFPMDTGKRGTWTGAAAVPFNRGEKLFADRGYTLAEVPEAFQGASFLRLSLDGEKTVRCGDAGVVWVVTPLKERNADSWVDALEKQGFQRMLHPEIRLFDPMNAHNFVTVYQKTVKSGESVVIGKWGVPLFFAPK